MKEKKRNFSFDFWKYILIKKFLTAFIAVPKLEISIAFKANSYKVSGTAKECKIYIYVKNKKKKEKELNFILYIYII